MGYEPRIDDPNSCFINLRFILVGLYSLELRQGIQLIILNHRNVNNNSKISIHTCCHFNNQILQLGIIDYKSNPVLLTHE